MTELEQQFLEAARRRAIDADQEAAAAGIGFKEAQRVIRNLLRKKLIYRSDNNKPKFFGGVRATYRAMT